MRKISYIAGTLLALLCMVGIARASGITFLTGGSLVFGTGGTATYSAPHGTIYGYSTHPSTSSTCGGNATYYAQLLAAGATWQRTDLTWKSVQATSSASYVWGGFDCIVNDATALGINTIFQIYSAPTWAAYPGCTANSSTQCAPVDAATYGTFCGASATHFLGRVHYYEVWNEPNISTFWSPSATTTDYVAALNSCYSAIKAADPTAQVIFGGLAPAATAGKSISIVDFTTQAYAAGPLSFDIMGAHPYTYPQNLNEASGDSSNNGWKAMLAVEGIMAANGDASKKIWITEYGAPTCGPGSAKDVGFVAFTSNDYMTFSAQSILANEVISAVTGSSTIGNVFWYTLIDANSNNSSTRENCFGALFSSGNAKPVWASLRSN